MSIKSINYTLLFVDNEKKLFLSEPNPSFNKDLRETASRKHVYNLPAREMMTQLIKESQVCMNRLSIQKLENALYFGPFTVAKNEDESTLSCVASRFSRSHSDSKKSVYNSNIDYNLRELMQDFSTSSDVYFGWTNYYLCSYEDFRAYVLQKANRKVPKVPSFDELACSDHFFKEKIEIYKAYKAYADWLWWFPLWSSYRTAMVKEAKLVVDEYFEKKKSEAENTVSQAEQYEIDLDTLLTNIEHAVSSLPKTVTNVSLLINMN